MAEADQRNMSIVPYASSGDVVLRHNDAIVVFDHGSKQLVLQNANQEPPNLELADCPYCHRPMRDGPDTGRESRRGHPSNVQPGFVNPEYFRMLDSSLPGTPTRSGPPSPRRRLVQPAQTENLTPGSDYEGGPSSAAGISSAAFSPNYFKRFFEEEGELGRGGKGVVLLVKHVLDGVSLGHYACKRVPVGDDHEWLKKVLIEVQLLQHLSHQNLVSYRHVWLENSKLSNFGPSVPCAFILQQYCNAGDLHKYICGSAQTATTPQQLKDRLRRRSKGKPEPPAGGGGPRKLHFDEIYSFFKDITSGLNFLHVNGYIHRDLKPSNCLLHETGRELRVLVSDFGEVQSENTVRRSTGSTGTVSYCAPEVLRRVSPDGPFANFTFKSDVFSLGMILYFLCFAQLPYRNADVIDEDREDLDQLRAEISQWAGFDGARRMRPELPEKLYKFLTRLLSVDPDNRPTAEEVLEGIQAGAVNDGRRFHRNGSVPDIRSTSRVLPVDTPASNLPAPRSPNTELAIPVRPSGGYGSNNKPDIKKSREPNLESPANHQPRDQDLIVRQGGERIHPEPTHSTNIQRHLLLPPPSRFFLPIPLGRRININPTAIKVILAILKILSITQPCSPLAVSPQVFYPLLIFAVLDFWVTKFATHLSLLGVHLLAVGISGRFGALCEKAPGSMG